MPLPIIAEGIAHGLSAIPYARTILKLAPWLVGVYFIKTYFAGAKNRSERVMYSKVVLITVRHGIPLPVLTPARVNDEAN